MNKVLTRIYYNTEHPAGYGSALKLWIYTNKKYKLQNIEKWLSGQEAYTLHKPKRLKFTRSRYFVPNMNNLYQADLCDMQMLTNHNKGVKYILTVIDVFSKKAWAEPLPNKNASSIIVAFKKIFLKEKPKYLQTDKGKEFVAKSVQEYLKSQKIKFYTTKNPDTKASIVERFNLTLKTKMWKYFTFKQTYKYVDVLQKLINSYNNTVHSATNIAPNKVTKLNQMQVYNYLYSGDGRYKNFKKVKKVFKIGDLVRISREKMKFEKGYEKNWSTELFKISKVIESIPPRYEIKDLKNEVIDGTFYSQELQKVTIASNTTYKINKILATRRKGGIKELYVSWLGYPDKFNSWIKEQDLS